MHISGCDVQFLHSIPFGAVHQGFLSSHFLTQSKHTQTQEVSKGHRQDSWSKLYKRIFQAIKLRSVAKAQGKGKAGRTSTCFPRNIYRCFPEVAGHLRGQGKTWIKSLFCFALKQLFHSILNCHFLNPWSITFLWFSSQPKGEESDQEVPRVFGHWPGSTHYSEKNQEKSELILLSPYFLKIYIFTVSSSSTENFVGFKSTVINGKCVSLLYLKISPWD